MNALDETDRAGSIFEFLFTEKGTHDLKWLILNIETVKKNIGFFSKINGFGVNERIFSNFINSVVKPFLHT